MKSNSKLNLFLITLLVIAVSIASVSATQCWLYETNETTCESYSDCIYKSDSWGSWCEQLNCWSLWSQTNCENQTFLDSYDLDCKWKSSTQSGWCEQTSCYSYEGTNNETCEGNSAGLACEWKDNCYGYNPEANCPGFSTQAECLNVSGCMWGMCEEKGCWNYWTAGNCALGTGSKGQQCQWNSNSEYCYESGCWDYSGTNRTACEGVSGLNCVWVDNYYTQKSCEEVACWNWDYTSSLACTNNSYNLSCTWDGQYCNMQGCWNNADSDACNNATGCSWKTDTGMGWCEQVECWSFDAWNGGDADACVNNSYNLSCSWNVNGWCDPDMGDLGCANMTNEKDCMDTYYCWWEYVDWNNISSGGECKDPMDYGDMTDTFFEEWNPGCYIFDMNSSDCNNVIGCNYAGGLCDPTDEGFATISYINEYGLNCSMMNDSQLCNNIPALSKCCEWKNGQCNEVLTKECWDNADRTQDEQGITACEDVSMQTSNADDAKSLCEQIAGSPLYMPCLWDTTVKECQFKVEKVFGNKTQSFALIDNKKNCQAAGGKWIKEWYCEGNRSVPAGRCEQKGNDEKNCDKACFACEYKFDGTAHNTSQTAKEKKNLKKELQQTADQIAEAAHLWEIQ